MEGEREGASACAHAVSQQADRERAQLSGHGEALRQQLQVAESVRTVPTVAQVGG
jgi:hypothetical protein